MFSGYQVSGRIQTSMREVHDDECAAYRSHRRFHLVISVWGGGGSGHLGWGQCVCVGVECERLGWAGCVWGKCEIV